MKTTVQGSCLCGAVRYRVHANFHRFYLCECAQCRKITGAVAAANLLADPAPIEWLTGADHVQRFDFPDGRAFTKVFCMGCGSGLPFLNISGTTLFVPAGSLDTAAPFAVQQRIFTAERADWAPPETMLPSAPGFPPD